VTPDWRAFTVSSPLRGFVRHTGADQGLLVRAWLALVATRVALWLLPFGDLRRRLPAMLAPLGRGVRDVERIPWAVGRAGRWVPDARCLARSLAGQALFAGAGERATLRAGIARSESGRVAGHAWLEWNGRVVIGGDEDLERYTQFAGLRDHP
jgi:hypothetical protein